MGKGIDLTGKVSLRRIIATIVHCVIAFVLSHTLLRLPSRSCSIRGYLNRSHFGLGQQTAAATICRLWTEEEAPLAAVYRCIVYCCTL